MPIVVKPDTATIYVTVIARDSVSLVPFTTTMNDPTLINVQDSMEFPEPVIMAGVRMQAALSLDRVTIPWKKARLVMVMVEVAV